MFPSRCVLLVKDAHGELAALIPAGMKAQNKPAERFPLPGDEQGPCTHCVCVPPLGLRLGPGFETVLWAGSVHPYPRAPAEAVRGAKLSKDPGLGRHWPPAPSLPLLERMAPLAPPPTSGTFRPRARSHPLARSVLCHMGRHRHPRAPRPMRMNFPEERFPPSAMLLPTLASQPALGWGPCSVPPACPAGMTLTLDTVSLGQRGSR